MEYNRWIILELSEHGELLPSSKIVHYLEELFGQDVDFFIPIHQEKMGSYVSTSVFLEGYVFVKDSPTIRSHLCDLRDYKAFTRVLGNSGRIETIDSHAIGVLKRRLRKSIQRKFDVGGQVRILDGIFSNLIGEIIRLEDDGKSVVVKINTLLSREIIAPVPVTSVENVDAVDQEAKSEAVGQV